MVGVIKSFGLNGLEGFPVEIEVDINAGLPKYDLVGLPDKAIKESKERVQSAIKNSAYLFPVKKITINLAPANMPKEGPYFDLGIAASIMVASGQVVTKKYKDYIFLGELSLDGKLRSITGLLPMIISAKSMGYTQFIIPKENENEACFIKGVTTYAFSSLSEVLAFLNDQISMEPIALKEWAPEAVSATEDFSRVKGQYLAKRAMEIAVSGGHNILMVGPPGSGKTMLAKCVPGILPDLTFEEALEVTKIHSVAGTLDSKQGIVLQRPFRAPHHTTTLITMVGGGHSSKPGEVSLAHNGVLFLDEMPEYSRNLIETLRQPLEDKVVTVARIAQTVVFAAEKIFGAKMGPDKLAYALNLAKKLLEKKGLTFDEEEIRAAIEAQVKQLDLDQKAVEDTTE